MENFVDNFILIKNDNNLLEKLELLKSTIFTIDEKRNNTISLNINNKELEQFYDEIITNLISFYDELLVYSNSKELLKASQNYILITNIIEKSYNEKDLVKNIFDYNLILNIDYNSFISLIGIPRCRYFCTKKNLTKEQLDFFNLKLDNIIFKI